MGKRLTLLEVLRNLPPTSIKEIVQAYAPDAKIIERDIARQSAMWQEMRRLTQPNDNQTIDLGLFAEETLRSDRWAGCDEVGRGPLAGPLVAASVILLPDTYIPGLRDSKQLSEEEREAMVPWIEAQALDYAVVEIDMAELNSPTANINSLSLEGMTRALKQLQFAPSFVLIDGRCRLPQWDGPQQALIKGDNRCPAIAAASVLAKVHRDHLMKVADKRWPQYGFSDNKGYGTAYHMKALQEYGICDYHRRNYKPVQAIIERN